MKTRNYALEAAAAAAAAAAANTQITDASARLKLHESISNKAKHEALYRKHHAKVNQKPAISK